MATEAIIPETTIEKAIEDEFEFRCEKSDSTVSDLRSSEFEEKSEKLEKLKPQNHVEKESSIENKNQEDQNESLSNVDSNRVRNITDPSEDLQKAAHRHDPSMVINPEIAEISSTKIEDLLVDTDKSRILLEIATNIQEENDNSRGESFKKSPSINEVGLEKICETSGENKQMLDKETQLQKDQKSKFAEDDFEMIRKQSEVVEEACGCCDGDEIGEREILAGKGNSEEEAQMQKNEIDESVEETPEVVIKVSPSADEFCKFSDGDEIREKQIQIDKEKSDKETWLQKYRIDEPVVKKDVIIKASPLVEESHGSFGAGQTRENIILIENEKPEKEIQSEENQICKAIEESFQRTDETDEGLDMEEEKAKENKIHNEIFDEFSVAREKLEENPGIVPEDQSHEPIDTIQNTRGELLKKEVEAISQIGEELDKGIDLVSEEQKTFDKKKLGRKVLVGEEAATTTVDEPSLLQGSVEMGPQNNETESENTENSSRLVVEKEVLEAGGQKRGAEKEEKIETMENKNINNGCSSVAGDQVLTEETQDRNFNPLQNFETAAPLWSLVGESSMKDEVEGEEVEQLPNFVSEEKNLGTIDFTKSKEMVVCKDQETACDLVSMEQNLEIIGAREIKNESAEEKPASTISIITEDPYIQNEEPKSDKLGKVTEKAPSLESMDQNIKIIDAKEIENEYPEQNPHKDISDLSILTVAENLDEIKSKKLGEEIEKASGLVPEEQNIETINAIEKENENKEENSDKNFGDSSTSAITEDANIQIDGIKSEKLGKEVEEDYGLVSVVQNLKTINVKEEIANENPEENPDKNLADSSISPLKEEPSSRIDEIQSEKLGEGIEETSGVVSAEQNLETIDARKKENEDPKEKSNKNIGDSPISTATVDPNSQRDEIKSEMLEEEMEKAYGLDSVEHNLETSDAGEMENENQEEKYGKNISNLSGSTITANRSIQIEETSSEKQGGETKEVSGLVSVGENLETPKVKEERENEKPEEKLGMQHSDSSISAITIDPNIHTNEMKSKELGEETTEITTDLIYVEQNLEKIDAREMEFENQEEYPDKKLDDSSISTNIMNLNMKIGQINSEKHREDPEETSSSLISMEKHLETISANEEINNGSLEEQPNKKIGDSSMLAIKMETDIQNDEKIYVELGEEREETTGLVSMEQNLKKTRAQETNTENPEETQDETLGDLSSTTIKAYQNIQGDEIKLKMLKEGSESEGQQAFELVSELRETRGNEKDGKKSSKVESTNEIIDTYSVSETMVQRKTVEEFELLSKEKHSEADDIKEIADIETPKEENLHEETDSLLLTQVASETFFQKDNSEVPRHDSGYEPESEKLEAVSEMVSEDQSYCKIEESNSVGENPNDKKHKENLEPVSVMEIQVEESLRKDEVEAYKETQKLEGDTDSVFNDQYVETNTEIGTNRTEIVEEIELEQKLEAPDFVSDEHGIEKIMDSDEKVDNDSLNILDSSQDTSSVTEQAEETNSQNEETESKKVENVPEMVSVSMESSNEDNKENLDIEPVIQAQVEECLENQGVETINKVEPKISDFPNNQIDNGIVTEETARISLHEEETEGEKPKKVSELQITDEKNKCKETQEGMLVEESINFDKEQTQEEHPDSSIVAETTDKACLQEVENLEGNIQETEKLKSVIPEKDHELDTAENVSETIIANEEREVEILEEEEISDTDLQKEETESEKLEIASGLVFEREINGINKNLSTVSFREETIKESLQKGEEKSDKIEEAGSGLVSKSSDKPESENVEKVAEVESTVKSYSKLDETCLQEEVERSEEGRQEAEKVERGIPQKDNELDAAEKISETVIATKERKVETPKEERILDIGLLKEETESEKLEWASGLVFEREIKGIDKNLSTVFVREEMVKESFQKGEEKSEKIEKVRSGLLSESYDEPERENVEKVDEVESQEISYSKLDETYLQEEVERLEGERQESEKLKSGIPEKDCELDTAEKISETVIATEEREVETPKEEEISDISLQKEETEREKLESASGLVFEREIKGIDKNPSTVSVEEEIINESFQKGEEQSEKIDNVESGLVSESYDKPECENVEKVAEVESTEQSYSKLDETESTNEENPNKENLDTVSAMMIQVEEILGKDEIEDKESPKLQRDADPALENQNSETNTGSNTKIREIPEETQSEEQLENVFETTFVEKDNCKYEEIKNAGKVGSNEEEPTEGDPQSVPVTQAQIEENLEKDKVEETDSVQHVRSIDAVFNDQGVKIMTETEKITGARNNEIGTGADTEETPRTSLEEEAVESEKSEQATELEITEEGNPALGVGSDIEERDQKGLQKDKEESMEHEPNQTKHEPLDSSIVAEKWGETYLQKEKIEILQRDNEVETEELKREVLGKNNEQAGEKISEIVFATENREVETPKKKEISETGLQKQETESEKVGTIILVSEKEIEDVSKNLSTDAIAEMKKEEKECEKDDVETMVETECQITETQNNEIGSGADTEETERTCLPENEPETEKSEQPTELQITEEGNQILTAGTDTEEREQKRFQKDEESMEHKQDQTQYEHLDSTIVAETGEETFLQKKEIEILERDNGVETEELERDVLEIDEHQYSSIVEETGEENFLQKEETESLQRHNGVETEGLESEVLEKDNEQYSGEKISETVLATLNREAETPKEEISETCWQKEETKGENVGTATDLVFEKEIEGVNKNLSSDATKETQKQEEESEKNEEVASESISKEQFFEIFYGNKEKEIKLTDEEKRNKNPEALSVQQVSVKEIEQQGEENMFEEETTGKSIAEERIESEKLENASDSISNEPNHEKKDVFVEEIKQRGEEEQKHGEEKTETGVVEVTENEKLEIAFGSASDDQNHGKNNLSLEEIKQSDEVEKLDEETTETRVAEERTESVKLEKGSSSISDEHSHETIDVPGEKIIPRGEEEKHEEETVETIAAEELTENEKADKASGSVYDEQNHEIKDVFEEATEQHGDTEKLEEEKTEISVAEERTESEKLDEASSSITDEKGHGNTGLSLKREIEPHMDEANSTKSLDAFSEKQVLDEESKQQGEEEKHEKETIETSVEELTETDNFETDFGSVSDEQDHGKNNVFVEEIKQSCEEEETLELKTTDTSATEETAKSRKLEKVFVSISDEKIHETIVPVEEIKQQGGEEEKHEEEIAELPEEEIEQQGEEEKLGGKITETIVGEERTESGKLEASSSVPEDQCHENTDVSVEEMKSRGDEEEKHETERTEVTTEEIKKRGEEEKKFEKETERGKIEKAFSSISNEQSHEKINVPVEEIILQGEEEKDDKEITETSIEELTEKAKLEKVSGSVTDKQYHEKNDVFEDQSCSKFEESDSVKNDGPNDEKHEEKLEAMSVMEIQVEESLRKDEVVADEEFQTLEGFTDSVIGDQNIEINTETDTDSRAEILEEAQSGQKLETSDFMSEGCGIEIIDSDEKVDNEFQNTHDSSPDTSAVKDQIEETCSHKEETESNKVECEPEMVSVNTESSYEENKKELLDTGETARTNLHEEETENQKPEKALELKIINKNTCKETQDGMLVVEPIKLEKEQTQEEAPDSSITAETIAETCLQKDVERLEGDGQETEKLESGLSEKDHEMDSAEKISETVISTAGREVEIPKEEEISDIGLQKEETECEKLESASSLEFEREIEGNDKTLSAASVEENMIIESLQKRDEESEKIEEVGSGLVSEVYDKPEWENIEKVTELEFTKKSYSKLGVEESLRKYEVGDEESQNLERDAGPALEDQNNETNTRSETKIREILEEIQSREQLENASEITFVEKGNSTYEGIKKVGKESSNKEEPTEGDLETVSVTQPRTEEIVEKDKVQEETDNVQLERSIDVVSNDQGVETMIETETKITEGPNNEIGNGDDTEETPSISLQDEETETEKSEKRTGLEITEVGNPILVVGSYTEEGSQKEEEPMEHKQDQTQYEHLDSSIVAETGEETSPQKEAIESLQRDDIVETEELKCGVIEKDNVWDSGDKISEPVFAPENREVGTPEEEEISEIGLQKEETESDNVGIASNLVSEKLTEGFVNNSSYNATNVMQKEEMDSEKNEEVASQLVSKEQIFESFDGNKEKQIKLKDEEKRNRNLEETFAQQVSVEEIEQLGEEDKLDKETAGTSMAEERIVSEKLESASDSVSNEQNHDENDVSMEDIEQCWEEEENLVKETTETNVAEEKIESGNLDKTFGSAFDKQNHEKADVSMEEIKQHREEAEITEISPVEERTESGKLNKGSDSISNKQTHQAIDVAVEKVVLQGEEEKHEEETKEKNAAKEITEDEKLDKVSGSAYNEHNHEINDVFEEANKQHGEEKLEEEKAKTSVAEERIDSSSVPYDKVHGNIVPVEEIKQKGGEEKHEEEIAKVSREEIEQHSEKEKLAEKKTEISVEGETTETGKLEEASGSVFYEKRHENIDVPIEEIKQWGDEQEKHEEKIIETSVAEVLTENAKLEKESSSISDEQNYGQNDVSVGEIKQCGQEEEKLKEETRETSVAEERKESGKLEITSGSVLDEQQHEKIDVLVGEIKQVSVEEIKQHDQEEKFKEETTEITVAEERKESGKLEETFCSISDEQIHENMDVLVKEIEPRAEEEEKHDEEATKTSVAEELTENERLEKVPSSASEGQNHEKNYLSGKEIEQCGEAEKPAEEKTKTNLAEERTESGKLEDASVSTSDDQSHENTTVPVEEIKQQSEEEENEDKSTKTCIREEVIEILQNHGDVSVEEIKSHGKEEKLQEETAKINVAEERNDSGKREEASGSISDEKNHENIDVLMKEIKPWDEETTTIRVAEELKENEKLEKVSHSIYDAQYHENNDVSGKEIKQHGEEGKPDEETVDTRVAEEITERMNPEEASDSVSDEQSHEKIDVSVKEIKQHGEEEKLQEEAVETRDAKEGIENEKAEKASSPVPAEQSRDKEEKLEEETVQVLDEEIKQQDEKETTKTDVAEERIESKKIEEASHSVSDEQCHEKIDVSVQQIKQLGEEEEKPDEGKMGTSVAEEITESEKLGKASDEVSVEQIKEHREEVLQVETIETRVVGKRKEIEMPEKSSSDLDGYSNEKTDANLSKQIETVKDEEKGMEILDALSVKKISMEEIEQLGEEKLEEEMEETSFTEEMAETCVAEERTESEKLVEASNSVSDDQSHENINASLRKEIATLKDEEDTDDSLDQLATTETVQKEESEMLEKSSDLEPEKQTDENFSENNNIEIAKIYNKENPHQNFDGFSATEETVEEIIPKEGKKPEVVSGFISEEKIPQTQATIKTDNWEKEFEVGKPESGSNAVFFENTNEKSRENENSEISEPKIDENTLKTLNVSSVSEALDEEVSQEKGGDKLSGAFHLVSEEQILEKFDHKNIESDVAKHEEDTCSESFTPVTSEAIKEGQEREIKKKSEATYADENMETENMEEEESPKRKIDDLYAPAGLIIDISETIEITDSNENIVESKKLEKYSGSVIGKLEKDSGSVTGERTFETGSASETAETAPPKDDQNIECSKVENGWTLVSEERSSEKIEESKTRETAIQKDEENKENKIDSSSVLEVPVKEILQKEGQKHGEESDLAFPEQIKQSLEITDPVEKTEREITIEQENQDGINNKPVRTDTIAEDLIKEIKVPESEKVDLLQRSTNQALQIDKKSMEEKNPAVGEEELQNKQPTTILVERDQTEEEEKDEDEHKMDESSSEAPVMVEASRGMDAKPAHKKSHNILSSVGSKVKHSIVKVKKAITGKSSHSTSASPNKKMGES